MSVRRALLQFAKTPRLGHVKTRLCPPLNPQQALDAHVELVRTTCEILCQVTDVPLTLWTDQQIEHPLFRDCVRLGATQVRRQCGSDLGQRMLHALDTHLLWADAVVLVGSDCPWLSAAYVQSAFDSLHRCDVVLGPASDGGYVLVGARRALPVMFLQMPWSTEQVLSITRRRLRAEGVCYAELPTLSDVDNYVDWQRWQASRDRSQA